MGVGLGLTLPGIVYFRLNQESGIISSKMYTTPQKSFENAFDYLDVMCGHKDGQSWIANEALFIASFYFLISFWVWQKA